MSKGILAKKSPAASNLGKGRSNPRWTKDAEALLIELANSAGDGEHETHLSVAKQIWQEFVERDTRSGASVSPKSLADKLRSLVKEDKWHPPEPAKPDPPPSSGKLAAKKKPLDDTVLAWDAELIELAEAGNDYASIARRLKEAHGVKIDVSQRLNEIEDDDDHPLSDRAWAIKNPETKYQPAQSADRGKLEEMIDAPGCKWPIGHPDRHDFHYCGIEVSGGKSYCQKHDDLVHGRTSGKNSSEGEGPAHANGPQQKIPTSGFTP